MAKANECTPVTLEQCKGIHRSMRWWAGGILTVLIALFTVSTPFLYGALSEGYEASSALREHQARQNGSLESINSQLNTIRQYHSTQRSDMKDMHEEFTKRQDKLDEIVREALLRPYPASPDSHGGD